MARFKVTRVIDGDTWEVFPNWEWKGQSGNRIRPTGYDAPELGTLAGTLAKVRLNNLILGRFIDIKAAYRNDRGRLVCDVEFNGTNLASYFPNHRV